MASGVMVTCLKCLRGSFAVTRAYAEAEVKSFNEYFNTLPKDKQELLYGGKGSSVENYEGCMQCGGKHFRLSLDGEIPDGVTINPVIWEGDA